MTRVASRAARAGSRYAAVPRGTTLIEVLLSVVLLGIGVITAFKLLNDSLQLLGENRYRLCATRLVADLAELLGNMAEIPASAIGSPAAHDCGNRTCNPEQFLADSLAIWQQRVAQRLPDGRGDVVLRARDGQTFAAITVRWSEAQPGVAAWAAVASR